jgi:sugar lactone lactonase YvrE
MSRATISRNTVRLLAAIAILAGCLATDVTGPRPQTREEAALGIMRVASVLRFAAAVRLADPLSSGLAIGRSPMEASSIRDRPSESRPLVRPLVLAAAATVAACLTGTARCGLAQTTGFAAADSAAVARAAWARGSAALRSRDTVTAHRELARAAAAWPTQPAYLWGRAVTAAFIGDSADTRDALAAYAALGLGRDLRTDDTFARVLSAPVLDALARQHDANRAPLVRSIPRARLDDSTFWPEGLDVDPRTGRYFVASVRHRTIAEVSPQGVARELWPRRQAGVGAVFAVRVDTARDVLWATMSGLPQMDGYQPADSTLASLLRVRIGDGSIERRWDLADGARHTLGDVAIGPRGDVFVSDSDRPFLYRLRPDADTLERMTHPLFRSLQGIAPAPDGRFVYVADYSHGLLRVDLAGGSVTRLSDAPNTTSLGCDGLVWYRNSLIAIQNGVAPARVMRFHLDSSGARIERAELLDRNIAIADEPTIGAVVGSEFVYVANSQWNAYDAKGALRSGAALKPPVLLAVPLPPTPRRRDGSGRGQVP